MELDFGNFEGSIELLQVGLQICENHKDSVPYMRKKEELAENIQDVLAIQDL